MIDRKIKEKIISKGNKTHQIKLKKIFTKAKNKCNIFNCCLYIGKKKVRNNDVKWYIIDKPNDIYTSIGSNGTLTIDVNALREKHGSVTIVAKYKNQQYYHIIKRWKDKRKHSSIVMGLGLGLGLGVPLVAGTAIGTFFGVKSYIVNRQKQQGSEKFTSWTTSDGKGILDWAKSAHFPANLPDKKIVDGGQVNQVKNFITEYLNPGVLADGLI
ncbi:MAG: hypothetical protein HUJ52_03245, partial [Malacoplasma sp.]|nr:hypothetical protein [Malacoplasma sp.]